MTTPVWGVLPTIVFSKGQPASFSFAGYISDPANTGVVLKGDLPSGVTFDAKNKVFIYDGKGGIGQTTDVLEAIPLSDDVAQMSYPLGTTEALRQLVPDTATAVQILIDRQTSLKTVFSDPTSKVYLRIFISLDKGLTWEVLGGFGTEGGIRTHWQTKLEVPFSGRSMMPLPKGVSRLLRAEMTVDGKLVDTSLKLQFSESALAVIKVR